MKNRKTQQERILAMLQAGKTIDLTKTPFTTKLSTRITEITRDYNLNIERWWRKMKKYIHPIRTYKLA